MPFLLRPAALADAPAILTLVTTVEKAAIGRAETDLGELETELRRAGSCLAENSLLAYADGALVAYGLVRHEGGERVDLDHYVLPGHQDAGAALLGRLEARAAEHAGAGRAVAHLQRISSPALDAVPLAARGWRAVRRFHVLTRAVSPASCPAPVPPPGVRVRACAGRTAGALGAYEPGGAREAGVAPEADRRQAHRLRDLAFAGHFDDRPRPYDAWLASLGEGFDWSLAWIASVEGLGDAGVLIARDDREATGWIRTVGVVEEARGRGVGGFLLRHAFHTFAERGRDVVGLGVDTRNATGAPRLYAANGMVLDYAVDIWERVFPASARA